jgi:hypothetical protein
MRCFWRRKPVQKPERAVLLDAIRIAIGNALHSPLVHNSDVASLLESNAINIRVSLSGAALAQPKFTSGNI